MAQLTVHGNWKSVLGFASFLVMVALIGYAMLAHEIVGIWLYVFALGAIILGFWAKEDFVAVGGITGLFAILMLDILYRIGLLGFTECKPYFRALFGCP